MGHWNLFCAVTHATIGGGDRCVGIWATEPKFYQTWNGNIAITPFYRGVYDSYGRVEVDEDEPHQDLIPIEKEGERDLSKDVSMVIREDVFDAILKSGSVGHYGSGCSNGSAFEESFPNKYNLIKLGFTYKGESKDSRYRNIYVHESEPNIEVWSDNEYSKVMSLDGKVIGDYLFSIEKFSKYFPKIDYTELKNTWFELNEIESEYFGNKENYETFSDEVSKRLLSLTLGHINANTCERFRISKDLYKFLDNADFRVKVAEIQRVYRFMYANNLKFGHRFWGGPQDGNEYAFLKLNEIHNMVAEETRKRIKEIESEDEEE